MKEEKKGQLVAPNPKKSPPNVPSEGLKSLTLIVRLFAVAEQLKLVCIVKKCNASVSVSPFNGLAEVEFILC